VEAYSLLMSRGSVRPMPVLLIVGKKGWLSEQLYTRIEELGLEKQVLFLHNVEDHEMPLFYAGARAFAFPSLYEGFGLPALEALATGVPVVSSNAGSLSEVVGDAGVLVDPHDVDGWAGALESVLLDPDLSARLRAAGPGRSAQFSWQRAARETLDLYYRISGIMDYGVRLLDLTKP